MKQAKLVVVITKANINMINHIMHTNSLLILTLVIALTLTAFDSGYVKESGSSLDSPSLKQTKDDLLYGQVVAVAYSGFRTGQHPDRGDGAVFPSDEEILEDLQILSRDGNFKLVRMYDSQENTASVLRIIRKHNIDIKVMLGIWLSAEVSNHEGCPWLTEPIPQAELDANKIKNRQEIERGIKLSREYEDIIVTVNVGNEALVIWNDHMVTVDSVISYVRRVKGAIKQSVTVNENYDWWRLHGAELAREVDYLGVHTYPAWEGKTIEQAMAFTIENLQVVKDSLPDSKIVIAEAGWATTASEFGERASEKNQQRYYTDLMAWAKQHNITTLFFEAFDEDWKGNPDNPFGAEKHWGLFRVDRTAKLVMHKKYPDLVPAVE